ncbi:MAG: hypothetical protein IRZ32_03135 [Solirubrobacteraceae bacterium]|nr:hypothetical protein [Solirubrobacteraceae bacterium]
MIYCVVPEPLADRLLPKLSAYYADDPNVTVIVDRRRAERRTGEEPPVEPPQERRERRDRRRARVAGDFPVIDPE